MKRAVVVGFEGKVRGDEMETSGHAGISRDLHHRALRFRHQLHPGAYFTLS